MLIFRCAALLLLTISSITSSAQVALSVASPGECTGENCKQTVDATSVALSTKTGDVHHVNGDAERSSERTLAAPASAVPPPRARNRFQDFARESVGTDVPMFGYNLFDSVPTTFAPLDQVPITPEYLVGPGDEVVVKAWGQIDLDARLVIDRTGSLYLPKVGNISVAGLRAEQLEPNIKAAVARVFRNFDLTASLGRLRSIQIFVLGQATRPGTYTVSSLSTMVNALFASGGPSPQGSMRNIQLKRGDALVTEFDLYDLLLRGDRSKDVQLMNGDVIYIPPIGGLVAITGAVNVPAIYELRSPALLRDVIAYAGGFSTTAELQQAKIERIEEGRSRTVEEVTLEDGGLQTPVRKGDVIRIFDVSPRFSNAVMLRGNVARPGFYAWRQGMRIRDLIPRPEMLITEQFWLLQNRMKYANPRGDAAVRTDAVRNSPDINWDYALLQRVSDKEITQRVLPFNLAKAIAGDPADNLPLEPGDIISVFSQSDLSVPAEKRSALVRLEGEFNASGVYRAEPGETLRQLVARAGGLSANAYLYGAQFLRISTRQDQEVRLRKMVSEAEDELIRNAAMESRPEDERTAQERHQRQAAFVERLKQIEPTGRIIFKFNPFTNGLEEIPDIVLEDGDVFVVQRRPAVVNVLGSVYNPNSFRHRLRSTVKEYVDLAGGATRTADKGRAFVIRADGTVISTQQYSGLWRSSFAAIPLMPGDTVVIPERLDRGAVMKGIKDWSQIVSQFALGIAAVRVLDN